MNNTLRKQWKKHGRWAAFEKCLRSDHWFVIPTFRIQSLGSGSRSVYIQTLSSTTHDQVTKFVEDKTDNFYGTKINVSVFDVFLPISPTGRNEIKHLSFILIQLRLAMFEMSPLSKQLLKGAVISARRLRRAMLIGTFHTCSPNSSRPQMKIAGIFPWNYLHHRVVHIKNRYFRFFYMRRLHIFASTLSDSCWSVHASARRLLIHLTWIFRFTERL
jgi:hypothetical protein